MAHVLFYEKPGCANNRRQRELIVGSGHSIEVRDLLSTPWDRAKLLPFLKDKPIEAWFNRASPRVKSGEIDPSSMDADSAMELLINDPLLIRRPLIQVGDWRAIGFEVEDLAFLLGREASEARDEFTKTHPESCHRKDSCAISTRKESS